MNNSVISLISNVEYTACTKYSKFLSNPFGIGNNEPKLRAEYCTRRSSVFIALSHFIPFMFAVFKLALQYSMDIHQIKSPHTLFGFPCENLYALAKQSDSE